jgi:hypothetical protein
MARSQRGSNESNNRSELLPLSRLPRQTCAHRQEPQPTLSQILPTNPAEEDEMNAYDEDEIPDEDERDPDSGDWTDRETDSERNV